MEGKEYAQNLIYGNPLNSFQLLPSYFYMSERENQGTVTKLNTDNENRFEYLFLTFGPYIFGFVLCYRPVMQLMEHTLKESIVYECGEMK